jgi:hypothetical protein
MAANSKRKRELLVDFYRLSKRTDEVVVALRRHMLLKMHEHMHFQNLNLSTCIVS